MKIDLHVHTKERSHCGQSGEEEMIQAAIAWGLDGLVFTDHDRLVDPGRLRELNRRYAPFRVFGGIEVTLPEDEHVLVLGVQEAALEARRWAYPDLYAFVRDRGGFIVLAHPFRYHDDVRLEIAAYPPDGVEVHSKNTGADDEPAIRALAERLGLRLLCNSDAHQAAHVGLYYNELRRAPRDDVELVEILHAGAYVCGRVDERIAVVNGDVERREAVIRRLLAEGGGRDEYRRRTGGAAEHYDRVARGKSACI